ncbi:MAG: hypothetical protein FJ125_05395 [Deltaproteobacteria bacterium]|nr:hypothetical protein [Deltaproteobacteria bacterium]
MEISVTQLLPYPRPTVFRALRDHLPALADYLPNIEYIQVKERNEPAPGETRLVNLWKAAKTEVPTVARAFLDPARLSWMDRAHWKEEDWTNTWDMEVSFMKDRVTCRGRTVYRSRDEESTEVQIKGVLELDLQGMLPGFIAKKAAPVVESFVIGLIKPNFEKVNDGLVRYLADHPEVAG